MISLRKKLKASEYNSNSLDKKLVFGLVKTRIPSLKQLKYINKYLNKTEMAILYSALVILIIGLAVLFAKFYSQNLETLPQDGGKYIEGVIGAPKYINPLYSSLNSVDADLAQLIYSSLFTRDNNGYLMPDLVTDYKISADQKAYTLTIRDDAQWHNGNPVTIDDVIFTFNNIKNGQYQSPLRYNFNGVEAGKIDDRTIQFTLKEPYAPFMEFLTFGILPLGLWQDVTPQSMGLAELNLKPIGSGPYQFKSLTKDKNGNIKAYTLEANLDYYNPVPHIAKVVFKFFVAPEEMIAALNNNKIDAASYLAPEYYNEVIAPNSFNFHQLSLPQISGLFFNLNNDSLVVSSPNVRQALAYAIDKRTMVEEVLPHQAQVIDGPILPNSFAFNDQINTYNYNPEKAKALLAEAGWELKTIKDQAGVEGTWLAKKEQILQIEITIPDNPQNLALAEKIKGYWETIGVKTTIKAVSGRDVQNSLAKTNSFTVLLYSLFGSIDPDPYTFWHSSQRSALNIAGYGNKKVDKLLEDARVNNNIETRTAKYKEFQILLTADAPAIFLYNPSYVYIQNKRIKGYAVQTINQPQDRLNNITGWYTKENKKINFSSDK